MKMRISSKDLIKISAYLDGELSASEKRTFEKRLRSDKHLQNALREMQTTKTMMRLLPRKRAPRSFTISESMVKQLSSPFNRLIPVFSYTSAASFVLALVLLLVNFLPAFSGANMSAPAFESAMEMEATDMIMEEEAPAIILWEGEVPGGALVEATGKGGAEEPLPQAVAPAEEMEMAPMEMEELAQEALAEESMPKEEVYSAEIVEEEAAADNATESAPLPTAAAAEESQTREIPQPSPTAAIMEKSSDEENGLILGIAPEVENTQPSDGEIAAHAEEAYIRHQPVNWLLITEIILISAAVLSAIAALILRRKV